VAIQQTENEFEYIPKLIRWRKSLFLRKNSKKIQHNSVKMKKRKKKKKKRDTRLVVEHTLLEESSRFVDIPACPA